MPNLVLSVKNFPPKIRERLEPILANGEFHHGDNLERMGAQSKLGKVCSMRLNKEARVMMAFVMLDGQPTWILLQVLENHNYQDAKALKRGWLDRFLQNNAESLSTQLREALKPKNENEDEVTELEYHNDHWIVLTDEQQKAHCLKGAVIVMGMPGSGKTILAQTLAIAEAQVASNTNDDDNAEEESAVAYITKAKDLAHRMRLNIQAVVGDNSSIQIFDFAGLPQELRSTNDDEKHHYLDNCLLWLSKHKLELNYSELGFEHAAEMHQLLYREFRIISGCDSASTYYNLGRRQALFAEEDRAAVYKIYTQYLKSEPGSIDYSLARIPPKSNKRFKRIFLDESQDFSDAELADLSALCDGQIVFLMDSNQSLIDVHSKSEALKRLLKRDLSTIVLPYTFRCSQAVTEAANELLRIKQQAMGGVLEKNAETQVKTEANAEAGKAVWIEHKPNQTQENKEIKNLQDTMGSSDRIIITWPEYFADAKALFPRTLVATPGQVKGSEFVEVVAFHLLDERHFAAINRLLGSDVEYREKGSRAKADRDRRELGPNLNQVFTTFTRARKQLIVLDDSQCHKTKTLTARIKQVCSSELAHTTVESASVEEWYKQAQKYLRENRFDLAKQVCDTYLEAGAYNALIEKVEYSAYQSDSSTASTSSTSLHLPQVDAHAYAPSAKSKTVKKKGKANAKPKKSLSTVDELYKAVRRGDLNAVVMHIDNGVSPIAKQSGAYPIHFAAAEGHLHIVCFLFEYEEVRKHLLTDLGNTPIHCAAERGHLAVVKYLHHKKVALSLKNNEDQNALVVATLNSQKGIIEYCHEQKEDFTVTSNAGTNVLATALKSNDLSTAELLVKLGCDVNELLNNNLTLLDYALGYENSLSKVQFLHRHGADLNAPNGDGIVCIEGAIETGALDVVRYLHENGVPLNQVFKNKRTPLCATIAKDNMLMVQYMVEHGASLEYPPRPYSRPLVVSIYMGKLEITQYLVKMGAQLRDNSTDFISTLYFAIHHRKPHIAHFLISEGANVDHGERNRLTPLHLAVEYGYLNVVKVLCAHGAKVDVAVDGLTPLHIAAAYNRYDEALCLMDAGANLNPLSIYGETPLLIATRQGYTNLVRAFIERGADTNLANIHGATPAHVANNLFVLKALKEGKTYFDAKTESGLSPIMGAVILGDLPRLMCLVNNCGANPLMPDKDGMSPLVRATILGASSSMITYLLAQQSNFGLIGEPCVTVSKANLEQFLKIGPLAEQVIQRFEFLFHSDAQSKLAQIRFFNSKTPTENTIKLNLKEIAWALGHKHLESVLRPPNYLKLHDTDANKENPRGIASMNESNNGRKKNTEPLRGRI